MIVSPTYLVYGLRFTVLQVKFMAVLKIDLFIASPLPSPEGGGVSDRIFRPALYLNRKHVNRKHISNYFSYQRCCRAIIDFNVHIIARLATFF